MSSLAISHYRQRRQADCLAACAAMVLDFLHSSIEYEQSLRLLGIRYFGAAFSNLRNLGSLGVAVTIDKGSVDSLKRYLASGSPVIVALNTSPLPYWEDDTAHAVVVVGLEQNTVLINDPAFEQAPQIVPLNAFLLGWLEQDYRYAVLEATGVT